MSINRVYSRLLILFVILMMVIWIAVSPMISGIDAVVVGVVMLISTLVFSTAIYLAPEKVTE